MAKHRCGNHHADMGEQYQWDNRAIDLVIIAHGERAMYAREVMTMSRHDAEHITITRMVR